MYECIDPHTDIFTQCGYFKLCLNLYCFDLQLGKRGDLQFQRCEVSQSCQETSVWKMSKVFNNMIYVTNFILCFKFSYYVYICNIPNTDVQATSIHNFKILAREDKMTKDDRRAQRNESVKSIFNSPVLVACISLHQNPYEDRWTL